MLNTNYYTNKIMKEETNGINWKDAFKDEGFLYELRKFINQYMEDNEVSEEEIEEMFNDIFKYDEKSEGLIVNTGAIKAKGAELETSSDDNDEQLTEDDCKNEAQKIRMSLLLSLMKANGLKINENNRNTSGKTGLHGNKKLAAAIMSIITEIPIQTCQNFITDPYISSKTPDDHITKINSQLIKIGLEIRLKK